MRDGSLRSAIGAILAAGDAGDVDRKIVDVLPGATGFERVALLSLPTMQQSSQVLYTVGYPKVALHGVPDGSPLASGGFLDGLRTGRAQDGTLPHEDVRGTFVLAPLREGDRLAGYVYADSLRDDAGTEEAASAIAYVLEIAGVVREKFSLIAERERLLSELDALSTTDALTSLANRRMLEDRMQEELHRSARSRRPFGLALFDLDRFNEINERFGHPAGDEALQHFAATVRARARHVDFVARFGGDEFGMLLVDVDHQAARVIVERILDALRQVRPSYPYRLSASAGVALSYPVDTVETLVERADSALHEAKQAGRDRAKVT
ncbi:MAG TPA: GGDEF domain-containing protein [Candidatus Baltobacteraceae bacterium]|jgi:diguanylate cyclase (GGDEF)-like protein|nr:GGDEF domain-containing protein [Candidatus Baltobacteraceae bacterium]